MLGFVFGTACLVGLVLVLRGFHRERMWGHRRFFRRPWDIASTLVHELQASPSQEKVIREELGRARRVAHESRRDLDRAQRAAGAALRGDHVDASTMSEALAQLQTAYERARDESLRGMTAIHTVLDPDQRRRFAELIASAPHGLHGHPYRCQTDFHATEGSAP